MVPRGHDSRLLICENVIPDETSSPELKLTQEMTAYDLMMMMNVAGKERKEREWRALLRSAGFRTVKIWSSDAAPQSVIEAVLD